VLGNHKNLLAVEEAFCQQKSYLEVRVFDRRPDRVRNHVRRLGLLPLFAQPPTWAEA
jgi:hypothetical protein